MERNKHEKHIHALERPKGQVDHSQPHTQDMIHMRMKPKTRKLQEDRAAEIQLENRILLQKMLNIDTKPSPFNGDTLSAQRHPPRSLHGERQRRELDHITVQNQAMLKRLQGAQPSIDPSKWYDDEVDRQALKYRLSQNSNRGRAPRLRLPDNGGPTRLPRIGGPPGLNEDDWNQLSDQDLDSHLRQLEGMRGAYPSVELRG